MAQVKKDPKSGLSKGFGFIRFSDHENQNKVIPKRHCIDGRWCDVRIPMSKDGSTDAARQDMNRKIFIGRLTSEISVDDLREYFIKYGEISDIFVPKPFRGFAFVTFSEPSIAQTLCGEDHIIKGISVHVSNAVPKFEMNQSAAYNNSKPPSYVRYSSNTYSNFTPNSPVISSPMSPSGGHHQANYSPPGPQYDYYSRSRSNHSSSTAYSRYGSFNSSDYTPYY